MCERARVALGHRSIRVLGGSTLLLKAMARGVAKAANKCEAAAPQCLVNALRTTRSTFLTDADAALGAPSVVE